MALDPDRAPVVLPLPAIDEIRGAPLQHSSGRLEMKGRLNRQPQG